MAELVTKIDLEAALNGLTLRMTVRFDVMLAAGIGALAAVLNSRDLCFACGTVLSIALRSNYAMSCSAFRCFVSGTTSQDIQRPRASTFCRTCRWQCCSSSAQ
jgi:hypothetical protein